MASQQQLADAQRVEQARISAEMTRKVLALWLASYEPRNPTVWRAVLEALQALVLLFRGESSRSAANYYLAAREASGVSGLLVPRIAPVAPRELVEVTARVTGQRAYERSLASGVETERARRNSGVLVAGAMSRIALDGGRRTILDAVDEDREAIGWARIADANPCAFCSMLVSRGPVFSEDTASFQAHAHCGCIAAPVFARDEVWLEHGKDLYEQWKAATAGTSGKDALKAWRRYWDGRNAPEKG